MGTNFYWHDHPADVEQDDITVHIGKRSAAGKYCYECGTTLCRRGTEHVHDGYGDDFDRECPSCGKAVTTGACSFTWTLMRHLWTIKELAQAEPDKPVIIDEYGYEYTAAQFLEEVDKCPIYFQAPYRFS